MSIRSPFITFALLLLAACGEQQSATTRPLPQVPDPIPASMQTNQPPMAIGAIRSDPAELCSGASRQRVTIAWDVRGSEAKSTTIHIGDGPNARLFFRGGLVGQKETGNWARPGMVFLLHDADTGDELGRTAIGAIDC